MRKRFIICLFLLFPLIEIAGFIIVGKLIGLLPTLLLIIASSILGGYILRGHTVGQFQQVSQRIQKGEQPTIAALDISLIMLGGFLLIIPGFFTSILGLLVLIPQLRQMLLGWLVKKGLAGMPYSSAANSDHIIEGEFKRDDDQLPPSK